MPNNFDPYQKWLGIPPSQQPPHHYRLLGLADLECDLDTIENAADRQMTYIRTFQAGQHADFAGRILNEIAAARLCLLTPDHKAIYDENLRVLLEASKPAAVQAQRPTPLQPRTRAQHQPVPQTAAEPLIQVGEPVAGSGAHRKPPSSRNKFPVWGYGIAAVAVLLMGGALVMTLRGSGDSEDGLKTARSDSRPSKTRPAKRPTRPRSTTPRFPSRTGFEPSQSRPRTGVIDVDKVAPPELPEQKPIDDFPQPQSGVPLARVEIDPTFLLGQLAEGGPCLLSEDWVFSEIASDLEGLEFATCPRDQTRDFARISSSGKLYVITHPSLPKDAETYLGAHAPMEKTDLLCKLRIPGKPDIEMGVYQVTVSPGTRFEINRYVFPVFIVSDNILKKEPIRVVVKTPMPGSGQSEGTAPAGETPAGESPAVEEDDESAAPEFTAERHPLPTAEQQKKIEAEIEEVFSVSKARTEEEKLSIAESLIGGGKQTADNLNQKYMMLAIGGQLAAEAGNLQGAFGAADEIEKNFETRATRMRLVAIQQAALNRSMSLEEKQKIFKEAEPLVQSAIADNYFDEAEKMVAWMIATSRRFKDSSLKRRLAEQKKSIISARRAYDKVASSFRKLENNPDDPAANTAAGKYTVFVQEQWEKGLAMLAKGNEEQLKAVAVLDLAAPEKAGEQVKVAEAWYDFAGEQPDDTKGPALSRAETWYTRALPELNGLGRAKAENRIAEIGKTVERIGYRKKITFPRNGIIFAACDYRLDIYVNGEFAVSHSGGSQNANNVFQHSRLFNSGDVITVRARRRIGGRAFACAIVFEGTKEALVTGGPKGPSSGWYSYRPEDYSYWYRFQQKPVTGGIVASQGTAAERVFRQTGLRCQSIWGTYDESPSSSYSNTYLMLQIK